MLAGLTLVGVGTFFAQATATGFIGRAATTDRGSASGLYLACYFFGGLVGTAVLGQLFDRLGWAACVAGIGVGAGHRGLARPRPEGAIRFPERGSASPVKRILSQARRHRSLS